MPLLDSFFSANDLTYSFLTGVSQVIEIGSVGKGLSQGVKNFFAHAEGVRS